MKYLVQPQADAAPFWEVLRNAPTKDESPYPAYASFSNFAEVVVYPYNVLQTWQKDQAYIVPTQICTTPVTHVMYFIPPKRNGDYRVFVGFVHDACRKMLVCEITLLQILIKFSKVVTPAGNVFDVENSNVMVVYKGQPDALDFPLKWQDDTYLHAKEVQGTDGNFYLEFEIAVPWLAEGTLNQKAAALSSIL